MQFIIATLTHPENKHAETSSRLRRVEFACINLAGSHVAVSCYGLMRRMHAAVSDATGFQAWSEGHDEVGVRLDSPHLLFL